jgi:hypothetical protein
MDVIFAPVALFCYNRPIHTQKVIDSLAKNKFIENTEIYVFCDGPKPNDFASNLLIQKVIEIVSSINFCKKLHIIKQEKNLGLANSIINGVSKVLEAHNEIIVLEDDILVSPVFLEYMNANLVQFKNNEKVISIHGYSFPVVTISDAYFLRGADCWGWATWKRGWDLFELDGNKMLQAITENNLSDTFDFEGSYPYTEMLRNQVEGKINSWAIRWYASAFLQNKLTLYPGKSLVQNIGTDGSGTNFTKSTGDFDTNFGYALPRAPETIDESIFVRKEIANYLKTIENQTHENIAIRVLKKIKYAFRKSNN